MPNRDVESSRDFLNEPPKQDWEKRIGVSGFEELKRNAELADKERNEYEKTANYIKKRFQEYWRTKFSVAKTHKQTIDLNELHSELTSVLNYDGLLRYTVSGPVFNFNGASNSLTVSAEYATYFHNDPQYPTSDTEKFPFVEVSTTIEMN